MIYGSKLIKGVADKRMELQDLYQYVYFEKLGCGRTRFDVFSSDEIDLLDDHDDYMMAVMDIEEVERQLCSIKQRYEAQLLKRLK